jgi:hypothetical protein
MMHAFAAVRGTGVALCVLLLGACTNPVQRDTHLTPVAVTVVGEDGVELARSGPGDSVTGQITVASGATRVLTIWFLNSAGQPIPLDGVEYTLRGEVVDPPTAEFEKLSEERGEIRGLTAGATQLRVQIWHGNHADFQRDLPLLVQ